MDKSRVLVHVTYNVSERVLQWAISVVGQYGKVPATDRDRRIAALLSTHRDVQVINVKIDQNPAA